MEANFSADSDSNKDQFFKPKRAATLTACPASFTVRIRLLHNDPESSLQNTPESVATALHTQHHKLRRNPLTAIVNGIWRAAGSRWQIVIQRFRIRLPGLLHATGVRNDRRLICCYKTSGLYALQQQFTCLCEHSSAKQSRTLLVETPDYRVGLQPSRNNSGGRMNRHGNLSSSVIANYAAVRRSRVSAGSATELLHTTGARNDGMHVAPAQRGAVLITGLIFLVILMLIGTTAMQGTLLEERMAGNLRDETLAFQAAEAALRSGEQFLEQVTIPVFSGSDGLFHYRDAPAPLDLVGWPSWETEGKLATAGAGGNPSLPDIDADEEGVQPDDADGENNLSDIEEGGSDSQPDIGVNGGQNQPRYIIEQLPSVPLDDNGSAQQSGTSLNASMFRIIARGVGGSGTTIVLLQSTYRR